MLANIYHLMQLEFITLLNEVKSNRLQENQLELDIDKTKSFAPLEQKSFLTQTQIDYLTREGLLSH